MWRIIYKNDHSRVLFLGGTSKEDCEHFLSRSEYEASEYIIQLVA